MIKDSGQCSLEDARGWWQLIAVKKSCSCPYLAAKGPSLSSEAFQESTKDLSHFQDTLGQKPLGMGIHCSSRCEQEVGLKTSQGPFQPEELSDSVLSDESYRGSCSHEFPLCMGVSTEHGIPKPASPGGVMLPLRPETF